MSPAPPFTPHYRMLMAGLGIAATDPLPPRIEVNKDFLLESYARLMPFDAAFYLATNADAREAVARGAYEDAQDHFVHRGFREGRLPQRAPFDPTYYAAQNPDLAALGRDGGAAALAAHFMQHGWQEGRTAHPDVAEDIARWRRAIARSDNSFAHRSIDKALVRAFMPPVLGPRGRGFRGGPVLGDAPEDMLLRHRREWQAIDSFPPDNQPAMLLEGDYIYGGPYCAPFGHAMAETIHRVLPARTLFDCRRLLFVGLNTGAPPGGFHDLPPVLQEALRFMDVAPREVTVLHDHRTVERLHLVQQGSVLGAGPSEAYLQLLADYTPARLDALHDGSGAGNRLYVSRSRMHGGIILGERYLERLLERDGFCILHPQDFALVAQMQAYRKADVVIFAEGSACHGLELLGAKGVRHCLLLPRRGHETRHVFDAVLRPRALRYDVLPDATLLGSIVADPLSRAPQAPTGVSVLNLPNLAAALRSLGVARLKGFSQAAYRRVAAADFKAYLAYHRATDLPLVDAAEEAALAARCAAAL